MYSLFCLWLGAQEAPTYTPNFLQVLLGVTEPQIYLGHKWSQWAQVLKHPTSLMNLQKLPFTHPLGKQQSLVSEIGFIFTRMRSHHWPVPWNLCAPCNSKAVRNTVDHCPLTSSHLHIPQVTCQSVKVMKALNGYHSRKRNNIAPIKGNEAVICKAWVYALESARHTVPYSAVWLGGGAGGWRVTG